MALIRLLARADLLDPTQADDLRSRVDKGANPLEVVLDVVDERALAKLLTEQFGFPLLELTRELSQPEAIRLVPRDLARRYDAMPVRVENGKLLVAFANPLDHGAIRAIEFAARCSVRVAVAAASQVRDAIHFAFDFEKEVAKRLTDTAGSTDKVAILEPAFEDEIETLISGGAESSSAIRLVELILVEGLAYGASDIHIEPTPSAVHVRYRIDGVMESGVTIPKTMQSQLVGRIKVMSSLDISERRRPQDGSMSVRFEQRRVDVRVSILPTPIGEKVVMRLLDTEAKSPSLDAMGYSEDALQILRRDIGRPEGLVLITGPTGSGKTTTAHAILSEIAKRPLNIVTLENPVEYRLRGVTQVEINEKQGVTFAGTLRSILRQDPDVIFVGEIRDSETAEIALRASHTGHLVLSTLHTIDAPSSISRLLDLGADPWMVAGSLRLVIAQRLVRELCAACREPHSPSDEELSRMSVSNGRIETAHRARGCRKCRGRGYAGRFSVSEVLPVSQGMRALLERRAPETELRSQARGEGVRSMYDQALDHVGTGRTSIDEVLRVIPPERSEETGAHGARCAEAAASSSVSKDAASPDAGGPGGGAAASDGIGWATPGVTAPPGPTTAAAAANPASAAAPLGAPTFEASSGGVSPLVLSPSAIAVSGLDEIEEADSATSLTVLVVDDEAVNRAVLRQCLKKVQLPLRVLLAEDGASALALLGENVVHLALVDLMMPGMSGIELCERIRADARYGAIPVFMLSAVEDTPHKTSAFEAGIDDYMVKPINAAELVARVTRALARCYPRLVPQVSHVATATASAVSA